MIIKVINSPATHTQIRNVLHECQKLYYPENLGQQVYVTHEGREVKGTIKTHHSEQVRSFHRCTAG